MHFGYDTRGSFFATLKPNFRKKWHISKIEQIIDK